MVSMAGLLDALRTDVQADEQAFRLLLDRAAARTCRLFRVPRRPHEAHGGRATARTHDGIPWQQASLRTASHRRQFGQTGGASCPPPSYARSCVSRAPQSTQVTVSSSSTHGSLPMSFPLLNAAGLGGA